MAVKLSTAAVNYITGRGSFRELLEDCLLGIWSGTSPATADLAASGSLLCIVSKASGSTYLRNGWGELNTVLVTDATAGKLYSFNVTINGETLLTTATYTVPAAQAVKDVAVNLVKLFDNIGLKACASGTDGYVYVMAPSGCSLLIALNTATLLPYATGAVTIGDNVYAVDGNGEGLHFGPPTAGVISKTSATWSGVNLLTGVAGYFRFYLVGDDHTGDVAPWTRPRVQGAISTSGVEGSFSNTTLTALATLTIGNCDLTLPLST